MSTDPIRCLCEMKGAGTCGLHLADPDAALPMPEPTPAEPKYVRVGRTGVLATWTEILGHQMLQFPNGKIARPCGECDNLVSGSKSYYAGIYGGVCFGCDGAGVRKMFASLTEAEKWANADAKRRASATRRAEAKAAAARAEVATWREANAALVARLDTCTAEDGEFLCDLRSQAEVRPLAERQIVAALAALDRRDERNASRAAEVANSAWLGDKNDEVELRILVTFADTYSGYQGRGWQRFVVGHTASGKKVKFYSSAEWIRDLSKDDQPHFTAKIKKLEERDGEKITVLTNVREVK